MTDRITGILRRYGRLRGAEPPCCSCSFYSGPWSCPLPRSGGRGGRPGTGREPVGLGRRAGAHARPARAGHHRCSVSPPDGLGPGGDPVGRAVHDRPDLAAGRGLDLFDRPGGRHERHRRRRSVDRAGARRPDRERPLQRRHAPRRSHATERGAVPDLRPHHAVGRRGRRCRPDRPTLLADPRPRVPHLASAAARRTRASHRRRRDVRPVAAPSPTSTMDHPNAGSGTVAAPRITTSWLEPNGPSARRARPGSVCASWRWLAAAPTTAALEELDLKLRASEAEREEFVATIQRLQATLAERDADVALARDGSGSRGDTKRINNLITDAENRVAAAERKAAAAEKKTEEAAKRATVTAERALEMEAQLKEAEQRAADAQKLAAAAGGATPPIAGSRPSSSGPRTNAISSWPGSANRAATTEGRPHLRRATARGMDRGARRRRSRRRRRAPTSAGVHRGHPGRADRAIVRPGSTRPSLRSRGRAPAADRPRRSPEARTRWPGRQDPRDAIPVPATELEMRPAQRHHPSPAVPHDDLAVAGPVPPHNVKQVAEQPEPLRVGERRPEPVLVLDDPTPQRDGPSTAGRGSSELVGALDGVQAARALQLGPNVRSVPGARCLGRAPGRPGPAVAGDRREPHPRPVPRTHERPRPPCLDRFGEGRDRWLEPGGHRLWSRPGAVGLYRRGLGRRFEVGGFLGHRANGIDLDDPPRPTDVH